MGDKTVFISYRREIAGNWFARSLDQALTHRGYDVFLDVGSIDAGTWAEQIFTQVQRRAHFLLLLTPGALDACKDEADWIRHEYELAVRHGRNIVPILEGQVQTAAAKQACPECMESLFELNIARVRHDSFERDINHLIARFIPPRKAPRQALMDSAPRAPRVAPSRLTHVAAKLFGRENELKRLDAAWVDPSIHVVTLVAWGGVGKTSLVARWAAALAKHDFDGADYLDWSFYSQGTREKGSASADLFVTASLKSLGDPEMANSAASPWDKGARLAQLIAGRKTLLILDGLEPLQHPPGSLAGELKDQAITALLRGLAAQNPGLCLVTTRERVADLAPFRETTAPEWQLDHLSVPAGVELLEKLGVHGTATDLTQLVKDVEGHALTLNLLGRYLARAHGGDVRRRDRVDLSEADRDIEGGHVFKTMAAYEDWLAAGDVKGALQLAVMRCLGLFDRPANAACLGALRSAPIIGGLTEPLVDLAEEGWNLVITELAECGLVAYRETILDAHPLIREYFGRRLYEHNAKAWRAAHGRLFEHFKESTEYQPDTLAGLQPLYTAMFHGCQAGRYDDAFKIYWQRVVRERKTLTGRVDVSDPDSAYVPGTNLGALKLFFSSTWSKTERGLSADQNRLVLAEASHYLFVLGQPREAVLPMRKALKKCQKIKAWGDACRQARLLREAYLTLGELKKALVRANESMKLAKKDHSGRMHPMATRSGLGQVLYYLGKYEPALQAFNKAEKIQACNVPDHPRLSFIWGFWYCEFLLGRIESQTPGLGLVPGSSSTSKTVLHDLSQIEDRARQALDRAKKLGTIFDIAHDLLTLGRVDMLRALLDEPGALNRAVDPMDEAVRGLRRTGQQHHLVVGLLSRAALQRIRHDFHRAKEDLAEAEEIAKRGSMRLYRADAHIERARLEIDLEQLPQARDSFKAAEKLVRKIGYRRRKKEMKTLKTMLY